jgi:predicted Zn-dependent protease
MYSGKMNQAILVARRAEAERPDHPLAYLLEAEALWSKIYCTSMERKWNTIDAWSYARRPTPEDDAYLALADKIARLAQASIAKRDTAEMELYLGAAYALRARSTGLRYEKIPTARAGIEARKHLLRCLELDPDMADAYMGLGVYNYLADALSAMAKVLRFFMGIPGGSKRVGLQQLEMAATRGELMREEARFNMAKSLRNYDHDYARAAVAIAPLTSEFPENPVFLLLAGDIEAKLGHNGEAAARFRSAAAAPIDDHACAVQVQKLAREALAALPSSPKS